MASRFDLSEEVRVLVGHWSDEQELVRLLNERPGLVVLVADPWSGASAVVASMLSELEEHGRSPLPSICVDARNAADTMDLAMLLGDAVVRRLRAGALDYWHGRTQSMTPEALAVHRAMSALGIDTDQLALGEGRALSRFEDALELAAALADADVLIAIEHLDLLLASVPPSEARAILGSLRAARQRHDQLQLLLCGFPDCPLGTALAERDHPLYHAGQLLRLRRAAPGRFRDDLASLAPDVDAQLVECAADLAAGVPWITWRSVELAAEIGSAQERAVSGWRRLRELTEPLTAGRFDQLRRAHPIAQPIVSAIAAGLGPHAVSANPKRVSDALRRLRALGILWQPRPRMWAISDPLLAAWARDHAPPWAARRAWPSRA